MSVDRLDLLVKVAEAHTDSAAEALGRAQAALEEQQNRLRELQRYLAEYRGRPVPPSASLMTNRERFIAKLDEAERQQQRTVDVAAKAVDECRQAWMEKRMGERKYDLLHDAALERERSAVERRDQNQLDEFSRRAQSSEGEPGAAS